jgi:arginine repressor
MSIGSMKIPNVVGTLGGDDTVFVVMRDTETALELAEETRAMLK